jgi:integrase
MTQRLTDQIVRSLPAPERGNKIHYDDMVKGFGIRVTAAGARAFIVNYRRRSDGLERRYTIGSYPEWSVGAARTKAMELKRHIDNGGDPVGEHAADRAAPTVADLAARFLEEHVSKQRPATVRDYGSMLRNDILPALGRMKVAAVEFEHVERLHARITQRAPIRANRILAVAAKMFALSIRWQMRPDNPCKGIERNREHGRRRYLTGKELAQLTKALAEYPNQEAADVIRLLLLTGCRKGEALSMRWVDVDLTTGIWFETPHSKQKQRFEIPLSAPARQLLARRHAGATTQWVFPGRDDARGHHRHNIKADWKRLCAEAKITGVRIHDLRHTFASHLVSGGASLPLVGALLGHSSPKTTHRYAHLFHDPQREAVERVGALVEGKPAAEVVPMKGGR